MATVKEWEDYFRALTSESRHVLRNALSTVVSDPMIKKEFGWTGIADLIYSIDYADATPAYEYQRR